jgi:ABC-type glycerol-3-phosphate transport system substrate-binding protein
MQVFPQLKMPVSSVIAMILLMAFCSSCGQKNDQTENKATVTFWHSFVASTIPSLEELIKKFEDEHPDIQIKAQYAPTGDALVQKLITAIQSQTAPDISWIHADFLDKLVEARAIYRMKEFIQGPNGLTAEELNDIFPPLLQAASWRDTLYALPFEYLDDSTMDAVFVDQMSWGQGRRPINFHRVEINRCLAEAIEKATLGKMDPKAALDEAAAKANKLLQPVGKMQLN